MRCEDESLEGGRSKISSGPLNSGHLFPAFGDDLLIMRSGFGVRRTTA